MNFQELIIVFSFIAIANGGMVYPLINKQSTPEVNSFDGDLIMSSLNDHSQDRATVKLDKNPDVFEDFYSTSASDFSLVGGCEWTGVFPVTGSCKYYYICSHVMETDKYNIYMFSCPMNQLFDHISLSCTSASTVTRHQDCMSKELSAPKSTKHVISFVNSNELISVDNYAHKRSKRVAAMTVLTGIGAFGTLALAANGIFNTGRSLTGSSGFDLKGLEEKLNGIDGKLNDINLSFLENQLEQKIESQVTRSLIIKANDDSQNNFEITQQLINEGFLENRIRTAAIQGLIIKGNIENESNFAKLQLSISEVKQFTDRKIREAKSLLKKGFDSISATLERSRIEPLVSKLLSLIRECRERFNHLQSLPVEDTKDEIEKPGGYLEYLESSTLEASLRDIIQQNLAIPSSISDLTAVFMLEFLVHCLQVHASMSSSIVSSNVYLASRALETRDLEAFNTYMARIHSVISRVKLNFGIEGQEGLIFEVMMVIEKAQNLRYASAIPGFNHILQTNRVDVNEIESDIEKLILDNTEIPEQSHIRGKPDFSNSLIEVPVGPWVYGKKVSYAIQLLSENSLSKIGKWSTPYTIQDHSNPVVRLPKVSTHFTRLVYRKFNQETPELVALITDDNQTSFRDIGRDFLNAASRPNEDIGVVEIQKLIKDIGIDIDIYIEKKMTALHYAAKNGNVKVMEILIDNGADVRAKASDEEEAIHFAAIYGSMDGVQYLIDSGAEVNSQTRLLGLSPLHLAVANNNVKTTQALLKNGAFVNIKDNNGLTPLHISVAGKGDTIDVLREEANIDINAVEEDGLTPLHYAARSSNIVFTRKLLLSDYIDVNARSKSHLTPIHLAAIGGNIEAISELFKRGAKVDIVDAYGSTPLHYAAFYGNLKVVLGLLELGPSLKDVKNKEDKTALELAIENNREEVVKLLEGDKETRIIIMKEQFGNHTTIPESDVSFQDQSSTNSHCSVETADEMAKGTEETCAHIGHVNSYVNLVMSTIPMARYYENHPEFSEIFVNYDKDLTNAKDHARIWRSGNSIKKGITSTFELARNFELEFSRKYSINQQRVERIKANADEAKEIKLVREAILSLEEQIENAIVALQESEAPFIVTYLNNMIFGWKTELEENKRKLEEDFTLIDELEELAAFMEFVRRDSLRIQTVAIHTQRKIEVFRDNLEEDKGAFQRHYDVARASLKTLEEEAIKNEESLLEYKRKGDKLELAIKKEKQEIEDRERQMNENHRELREMRREMMKKIGSNNILKIFGIILSPVIIGIPMLVVANDNEKKSINLLENAVESFSTQRNNLMTQINNKRNEINTFREMIANNTNNSLELRNNMNNFIYLNQDLECLSGSTDTLLESIQKALIGVNVIHSVFENVTHKLGEMILLAKEAKTEAERLNARYFIYTELELLECNWRDVYYNIMNLNECTKNFQVLY